MSVRTVCTILIAALSLCAAKYSEKQSQILKAEASACRQKLSIPLQHNYGLRAQSGDVSTDDPAYKRFVACEMRHLGIVDSEGRIKKQELINLLAEGHDLDKLREVIEKCAGESDEEQDQVTAGSADDRAFNFHRCFWTKKRFPM